MVQGMYIKYVGGEGGGLGAEGFTNFLKEFRSS